MILKSAGLFPNSCPPQADSIFSPLASRNGGHKSKIFSRRFYRRFLLIPVKDKINIEYVNFPIIIQIIFIECFSALVAVKYRLKVFLLCPWRPRLLNLMVLPYLISFVQQQVFFPSFLYLLPEAVLQVLYFV